MAAVIAKSEGRKSPYRIASAFIVSVGLVIGAGVSPAFADDAPDTDPDAHQVFQAPADEATVDALSTALKNLAVKVENETQLSKKIDDLGAAAGVEAGKVKDLEGDSANFGGWKAIDGGKFAVAKQSDAGVFPFTTVNETCDVNTKVCKLWRQENSVDENFKHALFLSQVRTDKTKDKESFSGTAYKPSNESGDFAAGIKGYNGIQKTFKAYSPDLGSRLKVSFTTGYTGDIEGKKAHYKVEVTYKEGGVEKTVYTTSFDPTKSVTTDMHTVLAAQDGTQKEIENVQGKSDEEIQTLLDKNKPNGRPGTFTSKEIELPKGVTEYTVKISSADNMHLGMSYQSKHEQYALPVVGKDFSISQDTKSVAKSLLKKIHAKLDASKAETTAKKTDASVKKYTDELAKVADLVKDEKELQENSVYTKALDDVLAAKEALASTETPAIAAVTDLAEQKVEEISANSSLNDEEKAQAKKRVNDEKEKAIKAIKEAADNAGVTKAKDAGIAAIAAVNPVGKESAKAEVRAALEKKLAELDDNKLLSEAERKAAKDQAQAKADAAIGEIDKQLSSAASADEAKKAQDAVNAAKDKGIADVMSVNPVGKESAKAEVRAALEKKLAELDDNKLLSEAERKAAKDQAQAKADAAIGEIDKQLSSAASADEAKKAQDAVNAAKDKGIADVMAVNPVGKKVAKEPKVAGGKKLSNTGTAGIFALICAMLGCCTAGAAAVAYRRRHASK